MSSIREQRCLGIIGGLGVGATVHYYQSIVDACTKHGLTPRLFIAHADVARVLANVRDGKLVKLAQYLACFAESLAAAGADIGAIAAVTPHICLPDIVQRTRLPLVNLLDETAREIKARGFRRVALFGTRFTIESKFFGKLDDIDVVQPSPEETDYIHRTYIEIVNAGRGSATHEAGLRKLANTLCCRDNVEAIVLAGTELNLIFNNANTDFPAIDCARAHIDGIIRQSVPCAGASSNGCGPGSSKSRP
jgi:aspartate racemase